MNLVYFTDGESLRDEELRAQCLRIPEVLQSLRSLQNRRDEIDLLSTVPFREEFEEFSERLKREVIEAIQQGIADRFFRRHPQGGEILRRQAFVSASSVALHLRAFLRTSAEIQVNVIGPGFDELPVLVREPRIQFIEVLQVDSELSWFWSEFKKAANS